MIKNEIRMINLPMYKNLENIFDENSKNNGTIISLKFSY